MNAGEVHQGCSSQQSVALAHRRRHQGNDHPGGSAGSEYGNREEDAAVAPMEVVALAEMMRSPVAQPGVGVEEAVGYIDCPSNQS
jgi:hypothetical protein